MFAFFSRDLQYPLRHFDGVAESRNVSLDRFASLGFGGGLKPA